MMVKPKQAYYGVQLADAFQQYKLEENTVQSRYLGVSSIKLGNHVFPFCIFYEITDSEISIVNRVKKVKLEQESDVDEVPSSPTALDGPIKTLPPKKRRRYLLQYEIIFSVEEGATPFSHDFTFYSLPQNAVTECLTETAPYKVLFSFYLGSTSPTYCCECSSPHSIEENSFKTTLDEFADVCSTSCKLALPYSSKSEGHVLNMIISSVSHELYTAIKQRVRDYEMMCQNMVELMKLHSDKVAHHKSEMVFLPETVILPISQSDDDYQASKNNGWSSDEERTWDKEGNESSYEEPIKPKTSHKTSKGNNSSNQGKKCLYCGSKSTPMWRRGPQGAGTLCNACGVKWKHGKILNGNDNAHTKHENKRRKSNTSRHTVRKTGRKRRSHQEGASEDNSYYNNKEPLFTAPAKRESVDQRPPLWEGQSTSSSMSDSCSPLESSPTYTPSFSFLEQDHYKSQEFVHEPESLSVYVGEDAVEAAAVLALLKRS